MEELQGTLVKSFRLHEEIARGGFGLVYRATQELVGRAVAIKVILPKWAGDPEFIRRFEAEARLVAHLEHPHIVPLYDYWRDPSGAFLVMRWMAGGTLKARLDQGPPSAGDALRIFAQVAGALAFAHRRGVIHRDLKPQNVLLDEDGDAYLADFGIAKDLTNDPLASERTVYTPGYAAPEQILGAPATPQSDVYSLALLLYELLAGERAFTGAQPFEIVRRQLDGPPPPLRTRRPDLPPALDAVLQSACAREPAERLGDVQAFVGKVRGILEPLAHGGAPRTGAATAPLTTPHATVVLETGIQANPYKGLRAFQEADAADFFGREALIRRLLARMAGLTTITGTTGHHTEPLTPATPPAPLRFLAVVGPSGSGKSSAVRAGLVPALRRGGLPGSHRWFVVDMVPGAEPFADLEAALLRVAARPPARLAARLRADEGGLLQAIADLLPPDPQVELLLVIDQLEELFTQVEDDGVRAHFLQSLAHAAADPTSRLRVVVTLRADFYDRPLRYAGFGELMREATEVVLPLNAIELEGAIVNPAARAGAPVDSELVGAIRQDLAAEPGALPLLQYALTELFERRAGGPLALAAYTASGGLHGILARRADEIYLGLDPEGQAAARQVFLRLVTPGEGTEDTRRRVLLSELTGLDHSAGKASSGPVTAVVGTYGQARLLTFDRDPVTREPTVEVAHEALIRSWERLRAWVDGVRDDLRQRQRLAESAAMWQADGRDRGALARGARLAQLDAWATATELTLNEQERAFLDASRAAAAEEEAARESARQHELEQARALAEEQRQRAEERAAAATRQRRRARVLAIVGALAVVAAMAAALFGYQAQQSEGAAVAAGAQAEQQRATAVAAGAQAEQQRDLASRQARVAFSRELAAQVLAQNESAPDRALLLGVEAERIDSNPATLGGLLAAFEASGPIVGYLRGHTDEVYSVAFSPDGKTLASVGKDGRVILWDAATGAALGAPLLGHKGATHGVAFSPDGKTLASSSFDKTVILWDLTRSPPVPRATLSGHTDSVFFIAFSPDGKLLASPSGDGTIRLWEVATGRQIGAPLKGHTAQVWDVAFSPDGTILASGSSDKTVRLWDVTSRQPIGQPLVGHINMIEHVAFSPDGRTLASSSYDNSVILWDVATGQPTGAPLKTHTASVRGVAFSPDGATLATSSYDKTIILWDVASRQPVRTLHGHSLGVSDLAFSPDGTRLASVGSDAAVILWQLETRSHLARTLQAPPGAFLAVALSPDGRLIAGAGRSRTIQLWDAATGQRSGAPLSGHTDTVRSLAFSPDGTTLASASYDTTIILWDVATRRRRGIPLIGHTASLDAVAFSPDGKTLISFDSGGQIILWDVATGQARGLPVAAAPSGGASFALSPDGAMIAVGANDGSITRWEVATASQIGEPIRAHSAAVGALAFSPDGRLLASGSEDHTIQLWDSATGQPVGRPLLGHRSGVWALAFSPDGTTLLSGGPDREIIRWDVATGKAAGQPLAGHTDRVIDITFAPDGTLLSAGGDGTIRRWAPATYASRGEPLLATPTRLYEVALTPDGRTLLAATEDQGIIRWDLASGQPAGPPLIPRSTAGGILIVNTVLSAPDGRTLASGQSDGSVIIWDAATGEPARTLWGHTNGVTTLAFSPDGRTLTSGSFDHLITVWDLGASEPVSQTLKGHDNTVEALAFSPDGTRLASADIDRVIVLWDVAGRRPLRQLSGSTSSIWSMAFSPDGRLLASTGYDGQIVLWNPSTGEQIGEPLSGGGVSASGLAFSPDGGMLASSNNDGAVTLWDVATRQRIGTLGSHRDSANSVAFTPDGRALVSAGVDGAVMIWDVDPAVWRARACHIVGRNLNGDEWYTFIPEQVYHPICPDLAVPDDALNRFEDEVKPPGQTVDPAALTRAYSETLQWVLTTSSPSLHNAVCWFGSLDGQAATVLEACQRTVELAPAEPTDNTIYTKGFYRDSLALAQALTGDLVGAAEGFGVYVEWTKAYNSYDQYGKKREAWIAELQAGRNPFDEVTLAKLREDYEGEPLDDTPPETSALPYHDDFADPASGWKAMGGEAGYEHGSYVLRSDGKQAAEVVYALSDKIFGDFALEVDVTASSTVDLEGYFGVLVRFRNTNYNYRFLLSDDRFEVLQDVNGVSKSLQLLTASPAIHSDGRPNRLRVECQNYTYTYYVNGVKLGEYVDYSHTDGMIGFILANKTNQPLSATFDNLEVTALP